MIKAIETHWKGYRFRSRLEARWAVFFEALGLKWEYEPEGFETRAGWYLPDFYLPEMEIYAEVKPRLPLNEDEKDKALWFVADGRLPLLILDGTPDAKIYKIIQPATFCADICESSDWDPFSVSACRDCIDAGIAGENAAWGTVCWYPKYLPPSNHDGKPRLFYEPGGGEEKDTPFHAIAAARSARFEHGEAPAWS